MYNLRVENKLFGYFMLKTLQNSLGIILTSIKDRITLTDYQKDAKLLEAVRNGDAYSVKALLLGGAKAERNSGLPQSGWNNPLLIAATLGHTEIVGSLLRNGATIDRSYNGATALMEACRLGHTETVKLLLDKGADHRIWNGNVSPLEAAAASGHAETVKALLDRGVDVHARYLTRTDSDSSDYTVRDQPLRAACMGGHESVVRVLLEAGADAKEVDGYSLKCAKENPLIARWLGVESNNSDPWAATKARHGIKDPPPSPPKAAAKRRAPWGEVFESMLSRVAAATSDADPTQEVKTAPRPRPRPSRSRGYER